MTNHGGGNWLLPASRAPVLLVNWRTGETALTRIQRLAGRDGVEIEQTRRWMRDEQLRSGGKARRYQVCLIVRWRYWSQYPFESRYASLASQNLMTLDGAINSVFPPLKGDEIAYWRLRWRR